MSRVVIYCTFLRKEEKSLYTQIKAEKLDVSYILLKNGFVLPNDSVVGLIRVLSSVEGLSLANILCLTGNKSINSPYIIQHCADKALSALLMQKHKVPQPEFIIIFSRKHLHSVAGNEIKFPFVIKPIHSSWGRGICLIKNPRDVANWLAGRESLDATNNKGYPIILQKYVEKPGYDLRVIIVGSKPVVAFKRISNHWITNTHLGAKIEPLKINKKLNLIINQITSILGAGFYGLDMFETLDKTYLYNETNHNPDFSNSSIIHKVDVAYHVAKYIKHKYEKEN